MYTFDGPNKTIELSAGTTQFAVQDMYSRWKEWVQQSDNSKYLLAFTTTGGDLITGSLYVGSYFFLENGWKIRPQNVSHNLTVDGNLFTRDSSNAFVPTLTACTVTINILASSLSQAIVVNSSGATGVEDTVNAILAKVNNIPDQQVSTQHSVNVLTELVKNQ